ncbi:MAG: hypothetical protein IAE96_12570 [Chitinophagaceae bacterium]|nr:hypothetical protein [Chitinophagaceae bacterium]
MRFLLPAAFLLISCSLSAQTRERWEQVVGWDGVSHWSRYMITLPAFQGPNSLPVPGLGNGKIDNSNYLRVTGAFHFSPGDNTQNLAVSGHLGIAKDLVDVELSWIPYERFTMSTAVKEKRHVYYEYFNEKKAAGDLSLLTNFRLLKKWSPAIDLILQVGYRFPSGTAYGAARYSDGPGYHFAVNGGKTLNKEKTLRLTAMAGFLVWQIQSDEFRQDDAFLFGAGFDWDKKTFRLRTDLSGYLGYLEKQGDKPVLIRTLFEWKMKKMHLLFGLRRGVQDFDYTTGEAGVKLLFR